MKRFLIVAFAALLSLEVLILLGVVIAKVLDYLGL